MKDLIKKILKEENDFDWVKDTNPISKGEIANELSDLQDWGYFIHQRRVESSSLVHFIYRLSLSGQELREMSVVLYDLSESIYESGKESGQQIGWEEGYREGEYQAERDSRYEIEDEIEDARADGYDDGYGDGRKAVNK